MWNHRNYKSIVKGGTSSSMEQNNNYVKRNIWNWLNYLIFISRLTRDKNRYKIISFDKSQLICVLNIKCNLDSRNQQ